MAEIMTDKFALRAIVILRVLARYARTGEVLPVMFAPDNSDDNLFNKEWIALDIDRTYPHGIRNRYQFFHAAHWLHDHGYLANMPPAGKWKRSDGYYIPTEAGYAAIDDLGEDWMTWTALPEQESERV